MKPVIVISDHPISSYLLINILSILAFILCLKILIKKWGNFGDLDFFHFVSWIFILGFLGSKTFYLLEDFDLANIKHKISNFKNGYVLYGGLISVFLSTFYYAKNKKLNTMLLLDLCTIALCLSISIGKIACLFTGCCYGIPTTIEPIGLVFTDELCLAFPKNEPLFPIQIMDSLYAFLLFLAFSFLRSNPGITHGRIFISFCIAYPVYRFISENFRADIARGFVFNGLLSLSQLYALISLIATLSILILKQYRFKKT